MSDNTSWQDRQTNNLTLEELRQWRIESTKDVTRQRKHASTHNRYLKDTIEDIESGERITTKKLEKLVASAKSKAGIDAAELLEFTLGDTKRNRELKKTLDAATLKAYLENVRAF